MEKVSSHSSLVRNYHFIYGIHWKFKYLQELPSNCGKDWLHLKKSFLWSSCLPIVIEAQVWTYWLVAIPPHKVSNLRDSCVGSPMVHNTRQRNQTYVHNDPQENHKLLFTHIEVTRHILLLWVQVDLVCMCFLNSELKKREYSFGCLTKSGRWWMKSGRGSYWRFSFFQCRFLDFLVEDSTSSSSSGISWGTILLTL